MKAAAGSLASEDCWVWRPAPVNKEPRAPAASAEPEAPPRHDVLPALGKTAKAKGQTAKWEKGETKKRR